jgi:hypothetical protein
MRTFEGDSPPGQATALPLYDDPEGQGVPVQVQTTGTDANPLGATVVVVSATSLDVGAGASVVDGLVSAVDEEGLTDVVDGSVAGEVVEVTSVVVTSGTVVDTDVGGDVVATSVVVAAAIVVGGSVVVDGSTVPLVVGTGSVGSEPASTVPVISARSTDASPSVRVRPRSMPPPLQTAVAAGAGI